MVSDFFEQPLKEIRQLRLLTTRLFSPNALLERIGLYMAISKVASLNINSTALDAVLRIYSKT
jgi:predicted component of type VI protein secretion system